jgi:cob(I)alamin adenosyltransferase
MPKNATRIEAYGEVDELSAVLGFARALGLGAAQEEKLLRIQTELMTVGAVLACPPQSRAAARVAPVSSAWVLRMEEEIEAWEKALPPLRQCILPGGVQASAALHLARTVARRAERKVVALAQQEEVPPEVLSYLNRLSDLLFMLSRAANHEAGVAEVSPPIPKTT